MQQIGAHRRRPAFVAGITCTILCCLIGIASTHTRDSTGGEPQPIDQDLFDHGLYQTLAASLVNGFYGLIQDYEVWQLSWLPIILPELTIQYSFNGGVIPLSLDTTGQPGEVLKQLIPRYVGAVPTYPVTVCEDPNTGHREILNSDGKHVALIHAEKGYSPDWYALERFPDLYDRPREEIDWLLSVYSPSRIRVSYTLIMEQDLIKYVWERSLEPEPTRKSGGGGKMMRGTEVDHLCFTEINTTDQGMEVVIGYPWDYTDRLDIFACT